MSNSGREVPECFIRPARLAMSKSGPLEIAHNLLAGSVESNQREHLWYSKHHQGRQRIGRTA